MVFLIINIEIALQESRALEIMLSNLQQHYETIRLRIFPAT